MLSSDERVEDVFFDSSDYLLSDESVVADEELGSGKFGYDLWIKEPRSVKERRRSFLCQVGMAEFASKSENGVCPSSQEVGFGRITDCNGAVSSSSGLCMNEANQGSYCEREMKCSANSMVDEWDHDTMEEQKSNPVEECEVSLNQSRLEECNKVDKKKVKKWWERLVSMRKLRENRCVSMERRSDYGNLRTNKIKVKQNKKKCAEVTALYMLQEIKAHKGYIWTMKFSPDGKYLATGGEDGIIRIWPVSLIDGSFKYLSDEGSFGSDAAVSKTGSGKKKTRQVPVLMPDKVFQIEESPVQEFHGHSSDVLDVAWSNSNCLLSCSTDKTVRMWQVGCDQCLNVFYHSNYVTCIQFNPADENYFISGSIDGKLRIWGVFEKRVVDWADVRDVISAICYRPNGKGFLVGTISGTCRFYESSGDDLLLETELHIQNKKKSSSNKITGIQFSQEKAERVMITTEDSKVRILEGVDVIHKFKGLPRSGSQKSASFTKTGTHIISVGGDSSIYVWNYEKLTFPSTKQLKSVRSCEHFSSEGVSVAVQWSGIGTTEPAVLCNGNSSRSYLRQRRDNLDYSFGTRDSQRFSLGSWFSMEGSCRGFATWPEEKLPLWELELAEREYVYCDDYDHDHDHRLQQECGSNAYNAADIPEMWGLVIVTGNSDGIIKTFHNYGLPMRL